MPKRKVKQQTETVAEKEDKQLDVKPDISTVEDQDAPLFDTFELDDRLAKGIASCGWRRATPVQAEFIPLALLDRDILARARTGSGKTAAFLIPIIQAILKSKAATSTTSATRISAVIVAPTRELCRQIAAAAQSLCAFCGRDVHTVDISHYDTNESNLAILSSGCDIIVGTPTRLLTILKQCSELTRNNIKHVVFDEADLLFSFGYHEATVELIKVLPRKRQTLLTSATLSSNVKLIKRLLIKHGDSSRPSMLTLKLNDGILPNSDQLRQYHICCTEEDKFVLLYALLKLRLLRGKCVMFVRDTDRCYRLRLFLEQFGIRACVLNANLPVNSRCHVVQQFNEDQYSYIIASDACELQDEIEPVHEQAKKGSNEDEVPARVVKISSKTKDAESGVGRGIDFARVANVVNFDTPPNVDTYIHRVGRTARGWSSGTALTFTVKGCAHDAQVIESVSAMLSKTGEHNSLKPYAIRMEELDGFRYRARDVLRQISHSRVREARLSEIRAELLRSKELQAHFAANPGVVAALRHDKNTHVLPRQQHLRHVPEYIVPPQLRGNDYSLPRHQQAQHGKRSRGKQSARPVKFSKKKTDPLRDFECDDE